MSKEVETKKYWLGGFFESGGNMDFITGKKKKGGVVTSQHSYPELRYHDNSSQRIQALQEAFGGTVTARGRNRRWWQWALYGQRVCDLTNTFISFAPSRTEIMLAYQNWEQADSEERVVIAGEMVSKGRNFEDLSGEEYRYLVGDLRFVAGVFDSRGRFAFKNIRSHGSDYVLPCVNINSVNRLLLEALHAEYGGSVFVAHPKSKELIIGGKSVFRQHDTVRWVLMGEKAQNLAAGINPYLIMQTIEVQEMLTS